MSGTSICESGLPEVPPYPFGRESVPLAVHTKKQIISSSPIRRLHGIAFSMALHALVLAAAFLVYSGSTPGGQGLGMAEGMGGEAVVVVGFVSLGNAPGMVGPQAPSALSEELTPASLMEKNPPPTEAIPVIVPEKPARPQRQEAKKGSPQQARKPDKPMDSAAASAPTFTSVLNSGNVSHSGPGEGEGTGGVVSGEDSAGNGSGKTGADFIYSLDMVDDIPKVIKRAPVSYPESARRNGTTGEVVVRFLLNEKGEISQASILKSVPPETFNASALASIKKWKIAPAVKNGKAVPVWVELPLKFSLK